MLTSITAVLTCRLRLFFLFTMVSVSSTASAGLDDLLKQAEEKAKASAPELLGSGDSNSTTLQLTTEELIQGLKEALQVGTQRAVDAVSSKNGYLDNPKIRIPLPEQLNKAGKFLRKLGLSSTMEQFEQSMNHAAEKAAPQAKDIFLEALDEMTIEDAKQIYQGQQDSATRYFEAKTRRQLSDKFAPLIAQSMDEVGVTKYYQQLVSKVEKYPLAHDLNLNLSNYVTEQALNGLFTMLATEEEAIRENPTARTTALLKKLFTQ